MPKKPSRFKVETAKRAWFRQRGCCARCRKAINPMKGLIVVPAKVDNKRMNVVVCGHCHEELVGKSKAGVLTSSSDAGEPAEEETKPQSSES